MATPFDVTPRNDRELTLGRVLDCSPMAAYRCWTEPDLIPKWFCPPPWGVSKAEMDTRAGGVNTITMRGPDGTEVPNRGLYLEVIPGRKLVFTSAFSDAWVPVEDGPQALMFVAEITFEDAGEGKTRYTARAGHWTNEAASQHEQMGFATGWGIAAEQLEATAKTL
jgi:uncharacterized protein YndB with AHSA1/START domain